MHYIPRKNLCPKGRRKSRPPATKKKLGHKISIIAVRKLDVLVKEKGNPFCQTGGKSNKNPRPPIAWGGRKDHLEKETKGRTPPKERKEQGPAVAP